MCVILFRYLPIDGGTFFNIVVVVLYVCDENFVLYNSFISHLRLFKNKKMCRLYPTAEIAIDTFYIILNELLRCGRFHIMLVKCTIYTNNNRYYSWQHVSNFDFRCMFIILSSPWMDDLIRLIKRAKISDFITIGIFNLITLYV